MPVLSYKKGICYMNAIFSIKKNYSDLIFDGTKDFEFRNKLVKVENGDKVYIYETKEKGCGKVVGYFVVDEIKEIPKTKLGAYNFTLHYAKKHCDEETISEIEKTLKIKIPDYNISFILHYLFDDTMLKYIEEHNSPPDFEWYLAREESKEEALKEKKSREKRDKLIQDIDNYLYQIGYYNDSGEAYWKYMIKIKSYHRFENPLDISLFRLLNGKILEKAPQSYCYTSTNI